MKERYFKFVLSILATFLCLGAFADNFAYEVSGVISDKKTGKTIEEAKVQLERNGEVIIETKTKADGTFVIRVPESDIALGKIKVRILKRGYKSQSFNAIPTTNSNLIVQLEKLKTVPMMVPKKSPTGQYIIVQNIQYRPLSNYKIANSIE